MRSFAVMAPVLIRTKDKESCATDWPENCQFYNDYQCELFHRGKMLDSDGFGESYRTLRHPECRRLTGDE